ncbi:hypothetical protein DVH05_028508 [Phytophthora capsici]|nr:hypothetical protein DVH05_028508 [Phytophthora capsici]
MKFNEKLKRQVIVERVAGVAPIPANDTPSKRSLTPDSPLVQAGIQKKLRLQSTAKFVDTISDVEVESISALLADLVFRTGIPFRVVDSSCMKAFVKALRPAYANRMPSGRSISGKHLDAKYNSLFTQLEKVVEESEWFSIVSDGWSNSKNAHFVNFIVIVPGSKPFFYKALYTGGVSQSGENIAAEILKVIERFGASKCLSVITDNATNMQSAWKIIETKYPHIFANGCAAHVMNLLIKDVCGLPEFSGILDNLNKVVKFVNDHKFAIAEFLQRLLSFPSKLIGKLESDSGDLYRVYGSFVRLKGKWVNGAAIAYGDDVAASLRTIVLNRWYFIHTPSMGFAYLLTPSSKVLEWDEGDKLTTTTQLQKFIMEFYKEYKIAEKCQEELENYILLESNSTATNFKAFIEMRGLTYWLHYGKNRFPLLAAIAIRVLQVPTSSAAAERVWSTYDFLWSKRRRCMNHRKVEKLAFNYINSGLLDTTDNRDYFGDDFNSFDMDIDSSNESDLEDQEMDTCGELNIAAGEERGSEAEEQENDHYLMDEGFDFEDL